MHRILVILFSTSVLGTACFAGGRDTWTVCAAGLVLCAALFLVVHRAAVRGERLPVPPMAWLIPGMLLYAAGVAVYRGTWAVSYPALLKAAVYALAYLGAFWFFDKSPKVLAFLGVLTAGAVIFTLYGLGVFLHQVYTEGIRAAAVSGPFVNKNHFAGFLEMSIPAAAAILFFPLSRSQKASALYALAVLVTGLGFSMSRGGWTSFALSLILYLALLIPYIKKKRAGIAAGTAVLIVLLTIGTFSAVGLSPLAEKVESTIHDEYLGMQGRYRIWESSFHSIKETPWLGKGPGTFPYLFQRYRERGTFRRVAFAHNDYIQLVFEVGLLGLMFILVMLGERIYPHLVSAYRFHLEKTLSNNPAEEEFPPSRSRPRLGVILGVIAAVTAIAVHSFVDFNLHLAANGILFSLLVGMGMRTAHEIPRNREKPEPVDGKRTERKG